MASTIERFHALVLLLSEGQASTNPLLIVVIYLYWLPLIHQSGLKEFITKRYYTTDEGSCIAAEINSFKPDQ